MSSSYSIVFRLSLYKSYTGSRSTFGFPSRVNLSVLYCTVLYSTVLYSTALSLYCITHILCCIVMQNKLLRSKQTDKKILQNQLTFSHPSASTNNTEINKTNNKYCNTEYTPRNIMGGFLVMSIW